MGTVDTKRATKSVENAGKAIDDILRETAILPHALTSKKEWKSLSSSAKEIYRVIVRFYDYEEGISRVSQREMQDESGIGARITIVHAIRALEEAHLIRIVVNETRNKLRSYNYLLPYQEKFYAKLLGTPERDLSKIYRSTAAKTTRAKNGTRIPDDVHPLFNKVWAKLDKLAIEQGHKLVIKYANKPEDLRTIMFMCDATYIVERHNVPFPGNGKTPAEFLADAIKKGAIKEEVYGEEATKRIRAILKKRLTQAKKNNITK